nr:RecName: Full=Neurotoxin Nk-3FTx [Naja kaouthia]
LTCLNCPEMFCGKFQICRNGEKICFKKLHQRRP